MENTYYDRITGERDIIECEEDLLNAKYQELCDIIEENKLPYQELKHLVESWGGNIEMFLLTELINNLKKN